MFRREVIQAIMQAERADQDGRRHEDGSPQGQDLSIDGGLVYDSRARRGMPQLFSIRNYRAAR